MPFLVWKLRCFVFFLVVMYLVTKLKMILPSKLTLKHLGLLLSHMTHLTTENKVAVCSHGRPGENNDWQDVANYSKNAKCTEKYTTHDSCSHSLSLKRIQVMIIFVKMISLLKIWYFVLKIVVTCVLEEKMFLWYKKTWQILGLHRQIYKLFEITITVYSYIERSEQLLK